MIIIVCLLHSKQRGALSFSESGRHGSHGCAVGELCVCCLGNQPTDSSRLLRTGCCCWRLISLLNSRADPWGEKLGLLKSVAKSCSFYLSQDFSLDLFVPEWAEEKVLSFLSAFFQSTDCVDVVFWLRRSHARCWRSCPAPSQLCLGQQERQSWVCLCPPRTTRGTPTSTQ